MEDWIERAKNGDLDAFEKLVSHYQRPLYNLALGLLNDPTEAEEATQDVFINVHARITQFRGESRFSTWLYRIATNACLDRIRKNKRERSHRVITMAEADPLSDVPSWTDHPEQVCEIREQRDAIRDAVAELPVKYRTPLLLHIQHDYTYKEIAEITDLSVQTVGTRIHRAKLWLRKRLQTEWKGGGE